MSALYRTLLRGLATRGRLLALGALAVLAVLLAVLVRVRAGVDRPDAAFSVVDGYGVSVLVPIVSLVFASAALGDAAEDGTLVYLWLRPVARWRLALAAAGAALTISLPLAVLPVVVAAAVAGVGARLVAGALVGALVAAVAYTAVFCGLGLRVRRALAWGLAYLVIWEQAVARVAKGAARVSISVSTRTITARIARHFPLPRNAMSMPVAVFVPCAAALIAVVLTTRSLQRGEVA
ncbi:MAG TPA: ABC transporter permease [Acidimicrobiales bacterium]|nr:ABC transporter permease [Acidimicrobiales bacterium]